MTPSAGELTPSAGKMTPSAGELTRLRRARGVAGALPAVLSALERGARVQAGCVGPVGPGARRAGHTRGPLGVRDGAPRRRRRRQRRGLFLPDEVRRLLAGRRRL
eukprot:964621-Prorocentrum_minimum.AAC.1